MATAFTSASELFDIADEFGLFSGELLRFRLRNSKLLSDADDATLEDLETQLDRQTAIIRAAGIDELAKIAADAQDEVKQASRDAQVLLKRIKDVERALGIATAVLGLALAVAAAVEGNLAGVLPAVDGVRKSLKKETAAG